MGSLYFLICSLFYNVLVMGIYFSKKKINSKENKIFSLLIIINFIGIILDITSVSMAKCGIQNLFFYVINKAYVLYLLCWITTFMYYTFMISFDEKLHSKLTNIVLIITFFSIILITCLPLYVHLEDDTFFTYGPSAIASYVIGGIYTFVAVGAMLANFKKIKKIKYLPLLAYICIGLTGVGVQLLFPNILVVTATETFVTVLMFFTIENPDMKLIAQLNEARDAADKANKAKSEFLSSMSHEIRTPLNVIVGFSQALSEEDLPESAKEEVKDIMDASNGLLEIVNGILDISKIEANKIEIVNTEYSFKDIYDNLIVLTKARLGDKPLEIRTSYDESIPKVLYGDHTRVKQIILNILTNAVKYTREGYIDFKVSSVISGDICRLIISVEDSGIGIKQENISKLFSKFERLDLEKNMTIEGTGLGLAITKRLVDLMNGTIVVQSVYGKGSKFTVALDQRIIRKEVEEKVEVLDTHEQKEVSIDGKKVLIVDDNKINLKVASRLLEGYHLDIETVDSGILCIQKIGEGKVYDLILMDDMMPSMSGVETLHKLKEDSSFNIPVIALTANAISGMREKYISEGFDDYLAKPIDKAELKKVIFKYLNK